MGSSDAAQWGRLIARHIREQLPSYRLGGLFRTTAHAEGLALELGDVPVLGLQQLIETCDLLVEATSAAAMPDIVRSCLAAGKAVVPLSVGGFSLDPALLRDVEAARAAVHVPSGAIAGLDGIRAMREMGLDAVTLTTVKHPRSLGQMPPLSELIPPTAEEALIMSPKRGCCSAAVEEAIRRFPANVNVAVSLAWRGSVFPVRGCAIRGSLCGRDSAPYFGQGRGAHWKR
ncbi:MAG: homoserine dehydrogenase [Bilophila wadsworthia]